VDPKAGGDGRAEFFVFMLLLGAALVLVARTRTDLRLAHSILNGIGPVVLSSVAFAENGKELAAIGASKDQLAVLFHLEEKKMSPYGISWTPPESLAGNSHLNMYAMNNGIPWSRSPSAPSTPSASERPEKGGIHGRQRRPSRR
jgi:hypothetical protein